MNRPLEFGNVGFGGGSKTGEPQENPSEQVILFLFGHFFHTYIYYKICFSNRYNNVLAVFNFIAVGNSD